MLEESNAYFMSWGYAWMSWYNLFTCTMMLIFGPCMMCCTTYRVYQKFTAVNQMRAKQNYKIEQDDEFEPDE